MTKKHSTTLIAFALLLTVVAGSTGCKSGGGSRWAWNPWSKSVGQEAAVLAEAAPKLPSDGATPLIEGLENKQQAVVAAAKTPPAMKGLESTMEAVAAATPLIEKPAPSSPNWTPYPSAKSVAPANTVAATTPAAPASTPSAAGGPYDPNGYQPAAPAKMAAATTDRYGLGNRYASSASPAPSSNADNPFGGLPATPAPSSVGGRYGTPAVEKPAVQSIAAATPSAKPTASPYPTAQAQPSTGSPYPQATTDTTAVASTTPQTPAYPSTGTSAPAYPIASTPVASAPAASTPTTNSPATSYPVASSNRYTATPTDSVYGASTTPIEPAVANSSAEEQGSVVRLTSMPGEYRPGGTSTYQPEVSVATRPEENSNESSATSRY